MTTTTLFEADARLTARTLAKIRGLDALLRRVETIRRHAARDREYMFTQPWAVFIRTMRLLHPQSYGNRIQNYLTQAFGWTPVDGALDRGDVVDADGLHWELKATLIHVAAGGQNSWAHFVQIRPHQDIAGYHLFVVDPVHNLIHLRLTQEDMARELALLGQSAHGSPEAVSGNATREYAIRFPWTPHTGTAQRWLRLYRQDTPAQP